MVKVAAQHDIAARQLDQQCHVPRSVARQVQCDDAAVAEDVDVATLHRLHFRPGRAPRAERIPRPLRHFEVFLTDQQLRPREIGGLADMIAVHVADPDDVDIGRLNSEHRELVGDGLFKPRDDRAHVIRLALRRGGEAGVPQQMIVAVADDIAAVGDDPRPGRIFVRVGEEGIEILDRPVAAVEPGDAEVRAARLGRSTGGQRQSGGDSKACK